MKRIPGPHRPRNAAPPVSGAVGIPGLAPSKPAWRIEAVYGKHEVRCLLGKGLAATDAEAIHYYQRYRVIPFGAPDTVRAIQL